MSQKRGLFRLLKRKHDSRRRERRYFAAIRRGEYALPPQSIKLATISNSVSVPRPHVFVETGTYYGDTVEAVKHLYDSIISIEVDATLYSKACERFAADANVRIVHGDCVGEMPSILAGLRGRAVFWLDGHYSGGVTGKGVVDDPILISLEQIAAHPVKEHVIFIDDARTFDGREGRPDISDVFNYIKKIDERYIIRVQNDIIIATVTSLLVC